MKINVTETQVTLTFDRARLPRTEVMRRYDHGPVDHVAIHEHDPLREQFARVRAHESVYSEYLRNLVAAALATHLAYTEAEETQDTFLREQLSAIIDEAEDHEQSAHIIAQRLMDQGVYLLDPRPRL